ncbi:MAG: hypothetical protein EON60_12750 [Alphaproteobacteria bacterium]|nr:MAG: hypothetical protein EON60_12750 [Alphaproteobacteria bacterium]
MALILVGLGLVFVLMYMRNRLKGRVTTKDRSALEAELKAANVKVGELEEALASARHFFGDASITSLKKLDAAFLKNAGNMDAILQDLNMMFPELTPTVIPRDPTPNHVWERWKLMRPFIRDLERLRVKAHNSYLDQKVANDRLTTEKSRVERENARLESIIEKAVGVATGTIEDRVDDIAKRVRGVKTEAERKLLRDEGKGEYALELAERNGTRQHEVALEEAKRPLANNGKGR